MVTTAGTKSAPYIHLCTSGIELKVGSVARTSSLRSAERPSRARSAPPSGAAAGTASRRSSSSEARDRLPIPQSRPRTSVLQAHAAHAAHASQQQKPAKKGPPPGKCVACWQIQTMRTQNRAHTYEKGCMRATSVVKGKGDQATYRATSSASGKGKVAPKPTPKPVAKPAAKPAAKLAPKPAEQPSDGRSQTSWRYQKRQTNQTLYDGIELKVGSIERRGSLRSSDRPSRASSRGGAGSGAGAGTGTSAGAGAGASASSSRPPKPIFPGHDRWQKSRRERVRAQMDKQARGTTNAAKSRHAGNGRNSEGSSSSEDSSEEDGSEEEEEEEEESEEDEEEEEEDEEEEEEDRLFF